MRNKMRTLKAFVFDPNTQTNHARHQAIILERAQEGRSTKKDWKREKRNHNKVEEK